MMTHFLESGTRTTLILGILLALTGAPAIADSANQETFHITGDYEGEVDGTYDLGTVEFHASHEGSDPRAGTLEIKALAQVRDPRTNERFQFEVTGRYDVKGTLLRLQEFTALKNGRPLLFAEEDEEEEEKMRTYLPLFFLVKQVEQETRYTVVPAPGSGAEYMTLKLKGSGDSRSVNFVVDVSDIKTGETTTEERARFQLGTDGSGKLRIESAWAEIFDHPSKSLDINLEAQAPRSD